MELAYDVIAKGKTKNPENWKSGYQTIRLNYPIPAVSVHNATLRHQTVKSGVGESAHGNWFVIERYDIGIDEYYESYALPRNKRNPVQRTYLLLPGSILNVGIAAPFRRGYVRHAGGGFQAELIAGPQPMRLATTRSTKRVRF